MESGTIRSMWKGCGKVSAEIIDINERARDAWDAYVAAKERAQATDDLRDGLAAGRAWRAFLNLFVRPEDRMEIAPRVLEYPYGARR